MKILIVGGGPVGLMTAILAKKELKCDVTVVESRPSYDRKQIVLLNAETYKGLPREVKSKIQKFGCFVLPPAKDKLSRCYKSYLPLSSISLKRLENALLHYAKKKKIKIIRPKRGKLNIKFQRGKCFIKGKEFVCDIIIGADGKFSQVRSKLLKSKVTNKFNRKKMYGVAINAKTTPNKLGGVYGRASKKRRGRIKRRRAQHRNRFFRSKTGRYYIGLVVNKKQYGSIKRSTGKKLPRFLKEKIDALCNQVDAKCQLKDIEEVFTFPIKIMASTKFSKLSNIPVYLVGDAALTSHFFTGAGVNVGIKCANILVSLLKKYKGRIPINVYKQKLRCLETFIEKQVTKVAIPHSKRAKRTKRKTPKRIIASS